MRFQYKLVLYYTILALLFSVLLGGVWHYFLINSYYQQAESNLNYTSQQMSAQFDSMYDSMKKVSSDILSTKDTYEAIRMLRHPESFNSLLFTDYKAVVRERLSTDYFMSNYYRVIFFNYHGSIIYSTMDSIHGFVDESMTPAERTALHEADAALGSPVITTVQDDPWSSEEDSQVFSMIRAIQGDSLGYIEVQQKAEKLDELFSSPDAHTEVSVILPDGQLLYSTHSPSRKIREKYQNDFGDGSYKDTEAQQMVVVNTTASQARIILSEDLEYIRSGMDTTKSFVFLAILCFFLLSIAFILIISRIVTKPVRDVRNQLEQTQWSNLGTGIQVDSSYDEIKALSESYNNLVKRLTESVENEKKLSLLQLQAQFDTLQAQVNPHFLYNVLNVISTRGIEDDDDLICDMCNSLAFMLRYSTSTKKRYATLEQELEYLHQYVSLMKARFEDRLQVEIDIQTDILQYTLPKITLQQLVENSIQHGFQQTGNIMEIKVSGWKDAKGWHLSTTDNGDGISSEILSQISSQIDAIRQKIQTHQNIEMEIGKMGLTSLYARLYLIYGENLEFEIKSREQCGTYAAIHIAGEETKCIKS